MLHRMSLTLMGGLAAFAAAVFVPGQTVLAQDKVTFVTDYGYLGRHSYYFVALEKGYYKDEGLEVDIVRGQGSADAVKQVGAGAAQLGFADLAAVIQGRSNDGVPVKMVSEIYAKPPHAVFCLKDAGITTAKDLEGKRIAGSAFSSVRKLFPAYAQKAGIDASGIKWLVGNNDSMTGMLALGRTDCVEQYVVGEALFTKAVAPKEISVISFADAGMDFYANGIIASDEIIGSNPDLVRRFVKATLRGLSDAVADPKEAGEILHKSQRQIAAEIGEAETTVLRTLVQTEAEGLGTVDPARVQSTIDLVEGAFDLKSPVSVDDVYAPGFVEAR